MVWIKRNLFFVIGTAVALLLLAGAAVYSLQSWSQNQAALEKLNEAYNSLRDLNNQKPSPGNDKVKNVEIARDQQKQVNEWLQKSGQYFKPIAPIPVPGANGDVDPKAFAYALPRTIDLLTREAQAAGVLLPPRYAFSFEVEQPKVTFAPGSPVLLARQLGEVKAIVEILYAARVNALDGVQRVRVSEDDAGGQQMDYLGDVSVTNDLAILTPYTMTFRGFSHELAQVVAGFATSPNGFIVRAINIEPAGVGSMSMQPDMPGGAPGMPSPLRNQYESVSPGASQTVVPPGGKGGLPTVLNEQLLRITMSVQIVKLLPKK
jgi:hypothetical protein